MPTVEVNPVRRGRREIGAYVTDDAQGTRFVPALDVTALATVAAVAVTGVAIGFAARRRPAIGSVTMGPGGWISLKRSTRPPLRAARPKRPWWARLLRARRLVEQR
ncbi:hypothetical protein ACFY36_31005 [Actinoplanes sp. NPDC000266]